MKLATFKSGGQEKIGIVHTGDTLLFDLAAAANRSGSANPAFASMLTLIDAGDAALEHAAGVFDMLAIFLRTFVFYEFHEHAIEWDMQKAP